MGSAHLGVSQRTHPKTSFNLDRIRAQHTKVFMVVSMRCPRQRPWGAPTDHHRPPTDHHRPLHRPSLLPLSSTGSGLLAQWAEECWLRTTGMQQRQSHRRIGGWSFGRTWTRTDGTDGTDVDGRCMRVARKALVIVYSQGT